RDHAGELGEKAVAHPLDQAPAVPRERGRDQLAEMRLQARQGAGLVATHHPAVARDIGRHDRAQAPLWTRTGHRYSLGPIALTRMLWPRPRRCPLAAGSARSKRGAFTPSARRAPEFCSSATIE